ncbi:DNA-protecting protein DprA [Mesobacillus zeae]|uniref:DNA-protecting protein DprA n=2 Tax=Mesobacillus zeae TaxID=1917180 RepID=A0A398BHQ0_9BACI|nr:DNA-protecting protein DprA [Mesobacillus zeae]
MKEETGHNSTPGHRSLKPADTVTSNTLSNIPLNELLSQYREKRISVITIFDKQYPKQLKTIYQPPWVLFAKGDTSLMDSPFLFGVVGSRNASPYGKKAINHLLPSLITEGAVIVSGLARGIDTCAHTSAISHGGKTIGVIAGGFSHIYPKENISLAEFMMDRHLLLSEYPPDAKPEKWHFPQRNRIISGLSKGVIVVEAGKKSGSLITADFALEQGREVFAVPGSFEHPGCDGTHWLIKQGAKLVIEANDILEELRY